ncbi:hypothetical protein [Bacillus sp. SM2101]|uniref:hypothetical protein n=1 Tax=Bacillus sp. SM2101 TaxID=2805366 RepID=UPI001BDE892D|nr:hypothetical protein [Bacillus sp. SM2101]
MINRLILKRKELDKVLDFLEKNNLGNSVVLLSEGDNTFYKRAIGKGTNSNPQSFNGEGL